MSGVQVLRFSEYIIARFDKTLGPLSPFHAIKDTLRVLMYVAKILQYKKIWRTIRVIKFSFSDSLCLDNSVERCPVRLMDWNERCCLCTTIGILTSELQA